MSKSKVAVLKCKPETILGDVGRLCEGDVGVFLRWKGSVDDSDHAEETLVPVESRRLIRTYHGGQFMVPPDEVGNQNASRDRCGS